MPDFAVKTAFTGIDKLSPVLGHMNNAVNKTFGAMGHGVKTLMGPFSGLVPALSIGGLMEFGNKCIDVFEKSEASMANVEAGLVSTHNKIGLMSGDFKDMAVKMSENGLFGKSDILQNATAQLLTFTGITKANFERVQNAAADVAAKLHGVDVTGEDLHATAIMMGKMMESPIKGLTAARRIGISFSKAEEEMVTSMVNSNNMLGAQNYMLKIIEGQYGGTSAALSKTSKGMEILAQHKMANTMAQIGKQLVPIKDQLFELALWLLPQINAVLPIFFTWLKRLFPIIIGLGIGFVAFKIAIMGVHAAQGIMMAAGWIKYLWMMRTAIMTAVVHTKLFAVAQWIVNGAMFACPIFWIIGAIVLFVGMVAIAIKNWRTFGASMTIFMGPLGQVIAMFKTMYDRWAQIKAAFDTGGIMQGLLEIGKAIFDGILFPIQQLLEILTDIPVIGKYAAAGAEGIKSFRENTLSAPNATEAEGKYSNSTNVNIYSNGTEAKAEVTPRASAKVNYSLMGAQ